MVITMLKLTSDIDSTIIVFTFNGLLSLLVEMGLLILFYNKHKYAKTAIKLWAIIFLSLTSARELLSHLSENINEGFFMQDLNSYLFLIITLISGIIIAFYANKAMGIITIDN